MWPFSKRKMKSSVFWFKPKDDITAKECEEIIEGSYKLNLYGESYVESLTVATRRHFKRVPHSDDECEYND